MKVAEVPEQLCKFPRLGYCDLDLDSFSVIRAQLVRESLSRMPCLTRNSQGVFRSVGIYTVVMDDRLPVSAFTSESLAS